MLIVIIIIYVDFKCEIVERDLSIMIFNSESWLLLPAFGINHFFCIINDLSVTVDIAKWWYMNTHNLRDTLRSITLLGPNKQIINQFHTHIGGKSVWTLEQSELYGYGNSDDKGHQLFVFKRQEETVAQMEQNESIDEAVDQMEQKYKETRSPWKAIFTFGLHGGVHATPTEIIKWLFTTINLQKG